MLGCYGTILISKDPVGGNAYMRQEERYKTMYGTNQTVETGPGGGLPHPHERLSTGERCQHNSLKKGEPYSHLRKIPEIT